MKIRNDFLRPMLAIFTACLCINSLAIAENTNPDATISLKGWDASLGVGVKKAKGKLHFNGEEHSFTLEGINLVDVGAEVFNATGDVTHLTNVSDFEGSYKGIKGGADIGMGGEYSIMKNDKGVIIRMKAIGEGLNISLGLESAKIKLTPEPVVSITEETYAPVLTEHMRAISDLCGCPVKIDIAWNTFKGKTDARNISNEVDSFIMAVNQSCSTPARKKNFCHKVHGLKLEYDQELRVDIEDDTDLVHSTSNEKDFTSVENYLTVLTK